MRILTYNIKDGGTDREKLLLDVIRAQDADVIGLVEADDVGLVSRFAGVLGMKFVHAPGRKGASALLTRYPIRDSVNHAPRHEQLTKSFAEVRVDVPGRGELTFGVLHLHAHAREEDESKRQVEIDCILAIMAGHRAAHRPHVLMGDFNSNSPVQEIDIERCKPSTREEYEANGRRIPRRVVQTVLDAGYTDVMDAVRPDLARRGGTFSTEYPGQRVDYVFTHGVPREQLRGADIVTAPPAKEASDHFPVVVEIG
jgi:endonuclease/exonuclease/phosphatase family metal-dependent hydrolase